MSITSPAHIQKNKTKIVVYSWSLTAINKHASFHLIREEQKCSVKIVWHCCDLEVQSRSLEVVIIIIIYPLTVRVVEVPQMISQPVSTIFPSSPLPSGTWQTPGMSIPWCCLPEVVWMGKAKWVLPSCKLWQLSYLRVSKKIVTLNFLPHQDKWPTNQEA